jgi:hypothetical protein
MKFVQVTRREGLTKYVIPISRLFMLHQCVSNGQDHMHKSRKVTVDAVEGGIKGTLKVGTLVKQEDFSQNYAHDHNEETCSEWFNKVGTTVYPVVVNFAVRDGKGGGLNEQHVRVYLSDHLKHSNKFVQMASEDCLEYFKGVMAEKGVVLTAVDTWSDGCAAQFKCRNQMKWLVDVRKRMGLEMVRHNFFSSCHGKGPCDAAGAVVKTLLRTAELGGIYLSRPKDGPFASICPF